MNDNDDLGTLNRSNGCLEGRLVRHIDHEQAKVWTMLTAPERLAEWMAPGSIELRQGGAVKINFADSGSVIDSTVTAFEAGRLLEYSWSSGVQPARPVRWELAAADGGTRLALTVRIPESEDIARTCAGWEAHLMMLMAAIEGVPIKFPFERFKATREAYKARASQLA